MEGNEEVFLIFLGLLRFFCFFLVFKFVAVRLGPTQHTNLPTPNTIYRLSSSETSQYISAPKTNNSTFHFPTTKLAKRKIHKPKLRVIRSLIHDI